MALKAVVDAVEFRLAANWILCPVIGANGQGETPDDGSAFLVVQYPVANASQTSIGSPGSNAFREEGAFRIVINVPRGDGLSTGLTWADTLAGLFRSKSFAGVVTFAPTSPAIDDRNDDGLYFVLSFAVPYQADLFG